MKPRSKLVLILGVVVVAVALLFVRVRLDPCAIYSGVGAYRAGVTFTGSFFKTDFGNEAYFSVDGSADVDTFRTLKKT